MWFYFMGWPALREKIWPSPLPSVDAAGKEIVVPPEPFNLTWFAAKSVFYCVAFAIAILLMIYFKQEGMLYVPAQPF